MSSFSSPKDRRPKVVQQHVYVRGQGRTLPVKLVLVGARSSASGDALDGKISRIRNRRESQKLFGAGSMLDLMVRMALASGQLARLDRTPGGTPELYCIPIAPVSGTGTKKSTQEMTLDGTATNSAQVTLHIQDLAIRMPVAEGETAAVLAERLVEYAKRVQSECAYDASVDGAVVTVTAKEAGIWGEQLYFGLDTSELNGITATVKRGTDTGVGELSIPAKAQAALRSVDWSCVCFPGSDALIDVIKSYVDGAWHYATGHAPLVVTACTGDIDEAMTKARAYNHRYITMAWSEHVKRADDLLDASQSARAHDFEVAAAVAARLFSQTKVNHNYNLASLPCYGRADSIDRDALNEAIAAGVTVVVQPAIGDALGQILDPVVTMSKDADGVPDTEWQPVECVRVVAEITRQLGAELRGFPRMDGDDDTRASAKSAALAVLRAAAKAGQIESPADDHVDAEFETVNGSRRLVVSLSYAVIVGLDIVEVTHNISRA